MKNMIQYVSSQLDDEKIFTETLSNSIHPQQTFVISHGLGGDSSATIPFIEELLKKIPNSACITYDIRGHGNSTRQFPSGKAIEKIFAYDLQSIIQQYQVQNPILIGHSLGGIISQEYVNSHLQPTPDSVVLLSSFPRYLLPNIGRSFWTQLLSRQKKLTNRSKRSTEEHFQFLNSFDYSPRRIFSDIQHANTLDFFLLYLSLSGWKNTDPQQLDEKKNLYVWGKYDRIVWPKIQRYFCRNMTQLTIKEISTNHNSLFNRPEEIAEMISEKITTDLS